jgi:hypothetical protein
VGTNTFNHAFGFQEIRKANHAKHPVGKTIKSGEF